MLLKRIQFTDFFYNRKFSKMAPLWSRRKKYKMTMSQDVLKRNGFLESHFKEKARSVEDFGDRDCLPSNLCPVTTTGYFIEV